MKTLPVLVALLLAAAPARAQVRDVEVTGGKVTGVAGSNGIVAFKGIPFAAAPVGPLRWKAPQPRQPWTGTLGARTFEPACVQDLTFPRAFGAPLDLSEDCLYLNV